MNRWNRLQSYKENKEKNSGENKNDGNVEEITSLFDAIPGFEQCKGVTLKNG